MYLSIHPSIYHNVALQWSLTSPRPGRASADALGASAWALAACLRPSRRRARRGVPRRPTAKRRTALVLCFQF